MKKKIFYSLAIVSIIAINLFNLQEEKSQDYAFLNLQTAYAEGGQCWEQKELFYAEGNCTYDTYDCWEGGYEESCTRGWEMICIDPFDYFNTLEELYC